MSSHTKLSPQIPRNWINLQRQWSQAYGQPTVSGGIKQTPEDFVVEELMSIDLTGEGEHVWLKVCKRQQNTETVAKQIARHANVAYRDVAYSGMKDFQAITRQWFSVHLPIHGTNKRSEPDWSELNLNGVTVEQHIRHQKKIKRGMHHSNRFRIIVRDLTGELNSIDEKLAQIRDFGVPNYFGAQRFGRDFRNMNQAVDCFLHNTKIKDRNFRGIILSSARSWLFNTIVSERVASNTWRQLLVGEPANLNGSASVFTAEGCDEEIKRLNDFDIHPTAPMWGVGDSVNTDHYIELHEWECDKLIKYKDLCLGLEKAKLKYQRRPLRMVINNLESSVTADTLELSFELQRGQFATSVLRELIQL